MSDFDTVVIIIMSKEGDSGAGVKSLKIQNKFAEKFLCIGKVVKKYASIGLQENEVLGTLVSIWVMISSPYMANLSRHGQRL